MDLGLTFYFTIQMRAGGFKPRSHSSDGDPRLWLPTALLVLDCVVEYVLTYFSDFHELPALMNRLEALHNSIVTVDRMHEEWMSAEKVGE